MSIDSGREYSIFSMNTEKTDQQVGQIVEDTRNKNEELIKNYSPEKISQTLKIFTAKARQCLKERFADIDVPISDSQIIDPLFVDDKYRDKLQKQLYELSDNCSGSYGPVNKRPLVFLSDSLSLVNNYNLADTIFHEMFHSTGIKVVFFEEQAEKTDNGVVLANKDVVADGRVGLAQQSPHSQYPSWLLEEGLAVYESAAFCQKLVKKLPRKFRKEFILHKQLELNHKTTDINPLYAKLYIDLDTKTSSLYFHRRYGLAGQLIETMIKRIPQNEQKDFVKTIYIARNDPKQVSRLAQKIDHYYGSGTYAKILKCEHDEWSVSSILQKIQS